MYRKIIKLYSLFMCFFMIGCGGGGGSYAPNSNVTLTTVTISPNISIIQKGQFNQYKATATYSDGNSSQITKGVAWSSSNTSVATIDDTGLAKIISDNGNTTIMATYSGIISSPATLNATNATVQSISITPSTPSIIANGLTQQYIAIATYSDGSTSQITSGVIWNSNNTSVATIDITGIAKVINGTGSTTISAKYESVTSSSTILTATAAIVQSISVQPFSATVANGLTQHYSATATYSDGSSSPITTGITWNSSNNSVATIDITGLATVITGSGNTTITATYGAITSPPVTLTASAI